MKVEIQLKGDVFTIHIDGMLHLYICEPIISIQSFNSQNKFYNIEYTTKHKTILTEYDSVTKWETVLKELNKVLS